MLWVSPDTTRRRAALGQGAAATGADLHSAPRRIVIAQPCPARPGLLPQPRGGAGRAGGAPATPKAIAAEGAPSAPRTWTLAPAGPGRAGPGQGPAAGVSPLLSRGCARGRARPPAPRWRDSPECLGRSGALGAETSRSWPVTTPSWKLPAFSWRRLWKTRHARRPSAVGGVAPPRAGMSRGVPLTVGRGLSELTVPRGFCFCWLGFGETSIPRAAAADGPVGLGGPFLFSGTRGGAGLGASEAWPAGQGAGRPPPLPPLRAPGRGTQRKGRKFIYI